MEAFAKPPTSTATSPVVPSPHVVPAHSIQSDVQSQMDHVESVQGSPKDSMLGEFQQSQDGGVSAVYFCFMGIGRLDKTLEQTLEAALQSFVANKLCTIRFVMMVFSIFCRQLDRGEHPRVILTPSGGTQSEFGENSTYRLPVNNKAHVIYLKLSYNEIPHLPLTTLQVAQWLAEHELDTIEIMTIFQQNNINIDNMKYLSEEDMLLMGIRDWGSRVALREAIRKHFTVVPKAPNPPQPAANPHQTTPTPTFNAPMAVMPRLLNTPASQTATITTNTNPSLPSSTPASPFSSSVAPTTRADDKSMKRKLNEMTASPMTPHSKKFKLGKQKIKYKELNVLVSDPSLPVHIGSHTFCRGSDIKGEVILNKHKKPMIRTIVDGKEHLFTVPQFYNHATGQRLQAKGESWANIFFTDPQTNTARSLADIKYLVEGPKKAVSAFLYFSKEIRDSLPRQDFARKSGDLWKSLSEEQRAPYKKLEEEDKARFVKDKSEWTALRKQANLETLDDWNGSDVGEKEL